jgi:hypothetical protein
MGGKRKHERDRRGSKQDGKKCVHEWVSFFIFVVGAVSTARKKTRQVIDLAEGFGDRGFVPHKGGESNAAGSVVRGRRSRSPAGLAGSLPTFCGD